VAVSDRLVAGFAFRAADFVVFHAGICRRATARPDRSSIGSPARSNLMTNPSRTVSSSSIFARRAGRIVASFVLIAGLVAIVASALSAHDRPGAELHCAELIGFTWLAALILGAATHGLVILLRPTWRPETALAESVLMPAAALALLLPLTLHLLVALATRGAGADFDGWVRASLIITGMAHLVFAGLCMLRAHRLLRGAPAISPLAIFASVVATSCVPFVVLFGVPPVLVALTGLPMLPLLHAMARWIERERAELAAMPQLLPRAALIPRRDR
jgi:hypothetical protein